ncbi:MAG: RDD family protein [bacterium]
MNPETTQTYKIAPVKKRIIAALIDKNLYLAVLVIAPILSGTKYDNTAIILSFFFYLVYHIIAETTAECSVGKKIMKLKVISADGTKTTPEQSLIRNPLRILDEAKLWGIIGLIMIWASEKKQRFGDYDAKTIVVTNMPIQLSPESS